MPCLIRGCNHLILQDIKIVRHLSQGELHARFSSNKIDFINGANRHFI